VKRLTDTLSLVSWAIFVPIGYLTAFIVFRPSLWELLILIGVDTLALFVTVSFEKKLFPIFLPDTKLFFPELDLERVKQNSLRENISLFESMVSFPARYARTLVLLSIPKAIPAFCVVVFFWQHSESYLLQFLKIFAIGLMSWSYFYGVVFIESHMFLSKEIEKLHRLFDWTSVFENAGKNTLSFLPSRKDFEFHENIAIISIWVFVLSLQWIMVMTKPLSNPYSIAFEFTLVGVAGLALMSRIWYLTRKYFLGGLQTIFETFERFKPAERLPMPSLALHSSPILAHFETTVNSLLQRLRAYEQELSHWTVLKAEQSRYRTLGEISGLIVHDLGAPLHVVNFCSQQLQEKPERIFDTRYLDQLTSNAKRSWELIDSLRAYLGGAGRGTGGTRFNETHLQVLHFLEMQFRVPYFEKIKFHVDMALTALKLKISKADLIHILYNLYCNSIENFTKHKIADPEIRISLREQIGPKALILIRDTGSGLSSGKFDRLTSFVSQKMDRDQSHGLGLKLVRRLVERNGGTLTVIDLPKEEKGTLFLLELELYKDAKRKGKKNELRKIPLDSGRRPGVSVCLR